MGRVQINLCCCKFLKLRGQINACLQSMYPYDMTENYDTSYSQLDRYIFLSCI